jgi:protein TonB
LPLRIKSIEVTGLSEQSRAELLASLPVHEGDEMNAETRQRATQAAKAFDEHLTVMYQMRRTPSGEIEASLQISAPGARSDTTVTPLASPTPATSSEPRIRVGANVQAMMIVSKVPPVYPPLAKSARVQGVVRLAAVIEKDGTVQEIHAIEGPPLLVQSAIDAVKQWVYRPTLLNGQPVQVETTMDVNYTLSQ